MPHVSVHNYLGSVSLFSQIPLCFWCHLSCSDSSSFVQHLSTYLSLHTSPKMCLIHPVINKEPEHLVHSYKNVEIPKNQTVQSTKQNAQSTNQSVQSTKQEVWSTKCTKHNVQPTKRNVRSIKMYVCRNMQSWTVANQLACIAFLNGASEAAESNRWRLCNCCEWSPVGDTWLIGGES